MKIKFIDLWILILLCVSIFVWILVFVNKACAWDRACEEPTIILPIPINDYLASPSATIIPDMTVMPSASDEAIGAVVPHGDGLSDNRSDGRSDGLSSCPECTKAPVLPIAAPLTGRGGGE